MQLKHGIANTCYIYSYKGELIWKMECKVDKVEKVRDAEEFLTDWNFFFMFSDNFYEQYRLCEDLQKVIYEY